MSNEELMKLLDVEHFEVGDKVVKIKKVPDNNVIDVGDTGEVLKTVGTVVKVKWLTGRSYTYPPQAGYIGLHDMHQRVTRVLKGMTDEQFNLFVKKFVVGSHTLQQIVQIRKGQFDGISRNPGTSEEMSTPSVDERRSLRPLCSTRSSLSNGEATTKFISAEKGSDEMAEEKKSHAIVVDISWTKIHDKTLHRRIKRVTGIVPLIDGGEVGEVETAIACLPLANLGNRHDSTVTEKFQVNLKGRHPDCNEETQMRGVAQLHNSMLRSIKAKAEQREKEWKEFKKGIIKKTKEAKYPENGATGSYSLAGELPFIGCRETVWEKVTIDEKEYELGHKKHFPRKKAGLSGGVEIIFEDTEPELLKLCADKCEEFTIAHREFQLKVLNRKLADKKEAEKNEVLRVKTVKIWARQHGSRRLKEQLKQGYEPLELYLEERMQLELAPNAKVFHCADAQSTIIDDPDENQLSKTRQVAETAVKAGLFENLNDCFEAMTVRKLVGCGEEKTVIVIEGVKPGKGFEEYMSMVVLDSKVVVSSADKYDALYDEAE